MLLPNLFKKEKVKRTGISRGEAQESVAGHVL